MLSGLLGDEEKISHLRDFISLPAHYASIRYATECLCPPKTVGYKSDDPQIKQIAGILNFDDQLPASPVKLLDFGAGKSRMLSGLVEIACEKEKKLTDYVDYFAFDLSVDDKEASLDIIKSIYGQNCNRHFSSVDDFFNNAHKSTIDVVVMCNVLHEISPVDWSTLFKEVAEFLKDDGFLLIVEDQLIPTGEQAHEFGFLVLDTAHLRDLFNFNPTVIFEVNCEYDGRLKAHKVPKVFLSQVNPDTIKKAIEELKLTAKRKIKEQRGVQNPDGKNGRLHSFWVQQFANASIFLE